MALASLLFPEHAIFPHFATIPLHRHMRSNQWATRYTEDKSCYKLTVKVPGIASDAVKLSVSDDAKLKVVVTNDSGGPLFERIFPLESDANPTSIRSWCADGLLEVTIDKLEPEPAITVDVQNVQPSPHDDGKEYELQRSLPGLSSAEVTVAVEDGIMRIHAKSTHGYGERHFEFALPEDAQTHQATAFCINGLLTVRMPRPQPTPPAQITVEADKSELPEGVSDLTTLEVPGCSATDVSVEATPDHIRLRLQKDGTSFERWFPLPREVEDPARLRAVCSNGVLHIGFIKSTHKTIDIEVASERPCAKADENHQQEEDSDYVMADK